VIRALSWILGMSYSVIDGLVVKFGTDVQHLHQLVRERSALAWPSRLVF